MKVEGSHYLRLVFILFDTKQIIMLLPKKCSIRENGVDLAFPPSDFVSIENIEAEEYMIGVVCIVHRDIIGKQIKSMQKKGGVPKGIIRFRSVTVVSTDCLQGLSDDCSEIKSTRN